MITHQRTSTKEMYKIGNGNENLCVFDFSLINNEYYNDFINGLPTLIYKKVRSITFSCDFEKKYRKSKLKSKRKEYLIDLSIYSQQPDIISYLSKILMRVLPKTKSLIEISFSNIYEKDEVIKSLVSSLSGAHEGLKSIHFIHTPFNNKLFKDCLSMLSPYKFEHISFIDCELSSQSYPSIIEFIYQRPRTYRTDYILSSFDLSDNKLKAEEIKSIQKSISEMIMENNTEPEVLDSIRSNLSKGPRFDDNMLFKDKIDNERVSREIKLKSEPQKSLGGSTSLNPTKMAAFIKKAQEVSQRTKAQKNAEFIPRTTLSRFSSTKEIQSIEPLEYKDIQKTIKSSYSQIGMLLEDKITTNSPLIAKTPEYDVQELQNNNEISLERIDHSSGPKQKKKAKNNLSNKTKQTQNSNDSHFPNHIDGFAELPRTNQTIVDEPENHLFNQIFNERNKEEHLLDSKTERNQSNVSEVSEVKPQREITDDNNSSNILRIDQNSANIECQCQAKALQAGVKMLQKSIKNMDNSIQNVKPASIPNQNNSINPKNIKKRLVCDSSIQTSFVFSDFGDNLEFGKRKSFNPKKKIKTTQESPQIDNITMIIPETEEKFMSSNIEIESKQVDLLNKEVVIVEEYEKAMNTDIETELKQKYHLNKEEQEEPNQVDPPNKELEILKEEVEKSNIETIIRKVDPLNNEEEEQEEDEIIMNPDIETESKQVDSPNKEKDEQAMSSNIETESKQVDLLNKEVVIVEEYEKAMNTDIETELKQKYHLNKEEQEESNQGIFGFGLSPDHNSRVEEAENSISDQSKNYDNINKINDANVSILFGDNEVDNTNNEEEYDSTLDFQSNNNFIQFEPRVKTIEDKFVNVIKPAINEVTSVLPKKDIEHLKICSPNDFVERINNVGFNNDSIKESKCINEGLSNYKEHDFVITGVSEFCDIINDENNQIKSKVELNKLEILLSDQTKVINQINISKDNDEQEVEDGKTMNFIIETQSKPVDPLKKEEVIEEEEEKVMNSKIETELKQVDSLKKEEVIQEEVIEEIVIQEEEEKAMSSSIETELKRVDPLKKEEVIEEEVINEEEEKAMSSIIEIESKQIDVLNKEEVIQEREDEKAMSSINETELKQVDPLKKEEVIEEIVIQEEEEKAMSSNIEIESKQVDVLNKGEVIQEEEEDEKAMSSIIEIESKQVDVHNKGEVIQEEEEDEKAMSSIIETELKQVDPLKKEEVIEEEVIKEEEEKAMSSNIEIESKQVDVLNKGEVIQEEDDDEKAMSSIIETVSKQVDSPNKENDEQTMNSHIEAESKTTDPLTKEEIEEEEEKLMNDNIETISKPNKSIDKEERIDEEDREPKNLSINPLLPNINLHELKEEGLLLNQEQDYLYEYEEEIIYYDEEEIAEHSPTHLTNQSPIETNIIVYDEEYIYETMEN